MPQQSQQIKITFLVDNNPSDLCQAEHGLSLLIESDIRMLFDTGQSHMFLDNASRLGLNIDNINTVALSHGHYDHGNGLEYLSAKKLVCHPGCFTRRYRAQNNGYIGLKFDKEVASTCFDLKLADQPLKLSDSITFLGEIPRKNSFEARSTEFTSEDDLPDYVLDDSALVIETSQGLIIVSGCAHSGICNIVDYACKVTEQNKVVAVAGGFHLKEGNPAIAPTIDYLKTFKNAIFLPCHCVDEAVMAILHQQLACEKVFAGKSICFAA